MCSSCRCCWPCTSLQNEVYAPGMTIPRERGILGLARQPQKRSEPWWDQGCPSDRYRFQHGRSLERRRGRRNAAAQGARDRQPCEHRSEVCLPAVAHAGPTGDGDRIGMTRFTNWYALAFHAEAPQHFSPNYVQYAKSFRPNAVCSSISRSNDMRSDLSTSALL